MSKKSHQWCILNKKHAKLLVESTDYMSWFTDCHDEHCYITKIFTCYLENEIIATPNLSHGATTFTNWEGNNYKYPSKNELKNYSSITEEELTYILDSKSLFGRKFNVECVNSLNIKKYIDCITTKPIIL